MKRIPERLRTPEARRLYWVWAAMIQRCENPKNPSYCRYGARGIDVCEQWRRSFEAFVADMGVPEPGLTIERVDGLRGYSPENCIWMKRSLQNANRPHWCRYQVINGEQLTLKDAWRRYAHTSVTYRSLVKRVVTRGWDIQIALEKPSR